MAEIKFSKQHKIKEDRFLETVFLLRKKADDNRKPLTYAAIGVLVAVLVVVAVFQYRARINDEAGSLFGKATLLLQKGNFTESLTELKKISEQYSGSSAASKALFLTGSVYYDLGNYELAIEAYKKYIGKYNGSEFLDPAVFKGLGASYMQLKDYSSAVDAFKKAISSYPKDFQIPEIRYKLALCYLESGDAEKAKNELKIIVKDTPKSQYANQADLMLVTMQ